MATRKQRVYWITTDTEGNLFDCHHRHPDEGSATKCRDERNQLSDRFSEQFSYNGTPLRYRVAKVTING